MRLYGGEKALGYSIEKMRKYSRGTADTAKSPFERQRIVTFGEQTSQAGPASIVAAVSAFYEAYPYPKYPLLASPRWQDGYLTHSLFARSLVSNLICKDSLSGRNIGVQGSTKVLIGGGGEILPYVVRKWEPSSRHVISVELSSSSIRRARWRLFSMLEAANLAVVILTST